ncbi:hypothetical protein TeGR_g2398 [Tetraparma gracilis]|uniref:Mitochondrial inner membrane protease ATP23 n=1 Tax=Tetraparma gracilis TaxID=2962635 RepID=A0ABQ6N8N0_9STRA|nr:hypothetical protein TeGR_g2398 [Tetraparma gracilis]
MVPLTPSISCICRPCTSLGPEASARAFVQAPPLSLVLCSDRLSPPEIPEVLVHELTHVFDLSRNLDFGVCEDLAFSEVRAARDAECAFRASAPHPLLAACAALPPGGAGEPGGLPPPLAGAAGALCKHLLGRCVRGKAGRATDILFPGEGGGCVARVFERAMGDVEPREI